jgi:hypothetical protein
MRTRFLRGCASSGDLEIAAPQKLAALRVLARVTAFSTLFHTLIFFVRPAPVSKILLIE